MHQGQGRPRPAAIDGTPDDQVDIAVVATAVFARLAECQQSASLRRQQRGMR
jgi:hypothetical protein